MLKFGNHGMHFIFRVSYLYPFFIQIVKQTNVNNNFKSVRKTVTQKPFKTSQTVIKGQDMKFDLFRELVS